MQIGENQANKGKESNTGREVKLLCFWSYFERFRHVDNVSSKKIGPTGSKVYKY